MNGMKRTGQALSLRCALPVVESPSYPRTGIELGATWRNDRHFQALRGDAVS